MSIRRVTSTSSNAVAVSLLELFMKLISLLYALYLKSGICKSGAKSLVGQTLRHQYVIFLEGICFLSKLGSLSALMSYV